MNLDRRAILKVTGKSIGAMGLASICLSNRSVAQEAPRASNIVGLPKDWRRMRKIDMHNHIVDPVSRAGANWRRVEDLIEAAEILGIEKLCCSRPITGGGRERGSARGQRRCFGGHEAVSESGRRFLFYPARKWLSGIGRNRAMP